jgi:hypothetical protein
MSPSVNKFNYNERWVVGTENAHSDKIYVKMFISVLTAKQIRFQKRIERRGKKDYSLLRQRWVEN